MRKFTLFLMSLFLMLGTAMAQNVAIYQITAKDAARGALYATAETTHLTHCGATYSNYHNLDIAVNAEDINQQFVFVEYDGLQYLYCLGAEKFAVKEDQFIKLTENPEGFVTIADADVDGYKLILFNGQNRLNFSGGYDHGCVANYETPDDGNRLTLTEIGTFDATTLVAAIEAYFTAKAEALATARTAFDAAYAQAGEILAEAELSVTETEVALQTTDETAAFYLWCNVPDPAEGSINALVDGTTTNGEFFHSSWHSELTADMHYLEVNLGEGNELAEFSLGYHTRVFDGGNDFPDAIQIMGSNDGENYTEVYNVTSGLPQAGDKSWKSSVISSEVAYRYFRFNVTAERTYWHMSEFDIFTNDVTVADKYAAVAKEIVALNKAYTDAAENTNYTAEELNAATEAMNASIEVINADVVEPEPEEPAVKEYRLKTSAWGMDVYLSVDATKAILSFTGASSDNEIFYLEQPWTGMNSYNIKSKGMSMYILKDLTLSMTAPEMPAFAITENTDGTITIKNADGNPVTVGTSIAIGVATDTPAVWTLEEVGGSSTPEAEAPVITSATPAEGATVESVKELVFTFDKAIGSVVDNTYAGIKVKAGSSTYRAYDNKATISDDGLTVTCPLDTEITTAGEYSVEIPAGFFVSTDGGKSEAKTYTFTVEEATVVYDNIADIAEGAESTIKGTVIATYSKGFLVQDETGMVLVYLNAAHEYVAGDVVTVNGVVATYGGMLQFPKTSVVEKTEETVTVEYPTATVMDGAALDAFLTAPAIQYVEYTGTLTISGSYYNVAVEGAATAMGSIQYPNTGLVTASTGDVVKVTGYTIGVSNNKYVNTMAVAVEVVEEAPEVEIPEYTVTEALEAYVEGSPAQVTVTGYIVGSVYSNVTNAAFGADATEKTNMLISDNPYTTDVTECLVIQLPSGDLRNKLNIVDNPANYRAEVVVTGSLEKYCGAAGVKNLTHGELTGNVAPEPAKPTLNETIVFDFVNNNWGIKTMEENNYSSIKTAGEYTDGTRTINIDPTANNGSYIYDSKGFLNISKPGSKIVLPAFDFAVEKIEVVGHSSATSYQNVDMNVYVGETAVSTSCIGSTATSTFEIAAESQAAGNVYELVIGSNGGNYSSTMYITYIKVYPAENKLEAPVIDLASGVYVGTQTVNVHSSTADIEGVTNVTYYYTTDGNEPTVEDEETDGEITIENSCTLKVIVELTYGDKIYVSASTSAEYIISEAVTYHRAVAVESGSYFIAANGYVAAPLANNVLPAVETTINGDDLTEAAYYAITLEEAAEAGTYYIKDVNGNYIYTSSMYGTSGPKLSSNGAYTPMSSWTITVAEDENSTATIVSEGLTLVYDTAAGVFKVTASVSDSMVLPTFYGTKATGIENAVINGEAIESIYDLQGRKLEKITKGGIYIVNGKKILVK